MMDPKPECFRSTFHEIALVVVISMAQFSCQGGITMCLSTMNIILQSFEQQNEGLNNDADKVWFMGLFALTVGTFILVSGKLGDLFGLKKVFVVGWVWVVVWSLITGLSQYSHSIVFFIICRAFQGIGFALLLPCGLGILGSIYPTGKRKNLAFGIVGASGPLGATLGAIFAAIFGQLVWWPWEFWVLAIVSLVLGVGAVVFVPSQYNNSQLSLTTLAKLKRIDIFGSCLGIGSLVLLNFVWNQGPVVGWDSAYIIVLLIVSVLGVATFFFVELKVAKYPLLPKSVFSYKIGLLLLCVSLGWGSFGIWQYYYWNIVLELRHYTAIEGSLSYIPFLVFGVIAALTVSVIISKVKPSYIILFSSLAFMCGDIMLSIMPIHQSYFRISMGQMFILTWGMDLSFPAASLILSDYLPIYHQGMAGSLISTVVNYSVSLFLAIASTVELQVKARNTSVITSYRAALHFGTAVAALGVLFSISFVIVQLSTHDKNGTFAEEVTIITDEIKDLED